VVNTAVLNGKQVSRPMKIFIVSRAGQVADVTLQASCRSFDESVLKVSFWLLKCLLVYNNIYINLELGVYICRSYYLNKSFDLTI